MARSSALSTRSSRPPAPSTRSTIAASSVSTPSSSKQKTTRQNWLPKYERELGVRPLNYVDGEVVEAICKFCEAFGREESEETINCVESENAKKRRKKSSKCQVWKGSFRRDHITKHLTSEHPSQFAAFRAAADAGTADKFFGRSEVVMNLLPVEPFLPSDPKFSFAVPDGIASLIRHFFCNRADETEIVVTVDEDIGDVVIADDFVETDEGRYVITIHDRNQFETILRCISSGVKYSAIGELFATFGRALSTTKLGTPNRSTVGRAVRYVVALNLSAIRLLLSNTWGFTIVVNGATHHRDGYLDVRVAFGLLGKVHNIHLLAIPIGYSTNTGENYAELVLGILDNIGEKNLLLRLMGISTDGAGTMLERHHGFSARLRAAARYVENTSVAVSWCGSHRLKLAVDKFLMVLDRKINFRARLGSEISFTRIHESVRVGVGLCPAYSTSQLESIHDTCHFLAKYYAQLIEAQDEKNYVKSSNAWWLCLFVVSELSEGIQKCFKELQVETLTMKDQCQSLDELLQTLQLKYESDASNGNATIDKVKVAQNLKWCSFQSKSLFDGLNTELTVSVGNRDGPHNVGYVDNDAGPDSLRDLLSGSLSDEESDSAVVAEVQFPTGRQQQISRGELVQAVADAVGMFVNEVKRIKHDINREARDEPPTRPADIVHCDDGIFRDLLVAHMAKLQARFGPTATGEIWDQRKRLVDYHSKKLNFRRRIENQRDVALEDAWKEVAVFGNFDLLSQFAVGLASSTPEAHAVDGDFSSLDSNSNRLSNYAMEGDLQSRQYFDLMTLADDAIRIKALEAAENGTNIIPS